jgi:hypothetical protein
MVALIDLQYCSVLIIGIERIRSIICSWSDAADANDPEYGVPKNKKNMPLCSDL